jgi:large subunit ribosomal protein L18
MAIRDKKILGRQNRTRKSIRRAENGRPRLSVHRSSMHIYAQVIDDAAGKTIAAASTLDKEIKGQIKSAANQAAAKAGGELIATRASAKGVKEVVFDRGRYLYHGRVKALAEAAREGGLKF